MKSNLSICFYGLCLGINQNNYAYWKMPNKKAYTIKHDRYTYRYRRYTYRYI